MAPKATASCRYTPYDIAIKPDNSRVMAEPIQLLGSRNRAARNTLDLASGSGRGAVAVKVGEKVVQGLGDPRRHNQ